MTTLTAQEDLARRVAEAGASARLVAAFRSIPRELFVPAENVALAYRDEPLPIPHGQVTTQPTLVARMVDALALTRRERVLEVGTGLGFQTAVLAALCAWVFSVERFADLSEAAAANLARAGVRNVTLAVGDGTLGLPEQAPFDAILASAALRGVPAPWPEQLRAGGRLVVPLGPGGEEWVTLFEKRGARLVETARIGAARFVRMVGALA